MAKRYHPDKVSPFVPQDKVPQAARLARHAMDVLMAARHTYEEYCLNKQVAPATQPPEFYNVWGNAFGGVFQPTTSVAPAFSTRSFPTNINVSKSVPQTTIGSQRNDPWDVLIQFGRRDVLQPKDSSSSMRSPPAKSTVTSAQGPPSSSSLAKPHPNDFNRSKGQGQSKWSDQLWKIIESMCSGPTTIVPKSPP